MQQQKAWFSPNKTTIDSRVKAVQNVNDPTILSDDVQRWSKFFIGLLLIFTTCLGTFSYFKFFENSFGFWFSCAMAVCLSATIEFGKNWGTLKTLRMPFFMGWTYIFKKSPEVSAMWVFLLVLSFTTFFASISNSTKGAKQLSLILGDEKNRSENVFQADTRDVDAQILALQKSIDSNRQIKWKGVTTYQAQKTIQAQSKSMDKLIENKNSLLNTQTGAFESERTKRENRNEFGANSLLLVGGFVEILQIVLMILRVAAERSMDKEFQARNGKNAVPQPTNNFSSQPEIPAFENTRQAAGYFNQERRKIGFDWQGYGEKPKNAVPQFSQQQNPPSEDLRRTRDQIVNQDRVLILLKSGLQKEMPNFRNSQAKPETVFARCEKLLNDSFQEIMHENFSPSQITANNLWSYLSEIAFPTMREHGFIYAADLEILRRLHDSANLNR